MNKLAKERAKELEFSSPNCHSPEGSTGKEDLLLTTQNPRDNLIILGWFPKCLQSILLSQKKFEDRQTIMKCRI